MDMFGGKGWRKEWPVWDLRPETAAETRTSKWKLPEKKTDGFLRLHVGLQLKQKHTHTHTHKQTRKTKRRPGHQCLGGPIAEKPTYPEYMAMGQNPNRLAPSEHPIQSNH